MKLQTTTTSNALKVRDFNELLSCQLCNGYLINPTTVDNCLHTFCRSCIVQHLQRETCCPQCKIVGAAKQINVTNLRSDDVLRALIFKLIPGLYQKERERTLQFKATQRNGQQRATKDGEDVAAADGGGVAVNREQDITIEENFFAPTEPISLSLEYHPALLKGCSTSQIPPVRYLQCPAGLKIRHLKRFLCSKFDIDPECKRIEVEVIYEDEVLPNDFTLMDVGYCYNWKRHAPMKFTYRILYYGEEPQIQDIDCKKSDIEKRQKEAASDAVKTTEIQRKKEMNICDATNITTLSSAPNTSLPNLNSLRSSQTELQQSAKSKNKFFKCSKTESITKTAMPNEEIGNVAPVKMIIARKSSADSGKKPSPKRQNTTNDEGATYAISNNDFKSLRSNDMRYSDYAVSSTTSNSNSPKSSPKSAQRSPKTGDVAAAGVSHADSPTSPVVQSASAGSAAAVVSKCEIVVSIPQSQMPKSPYSIDDEFENVSLAQLKTASKKSPPAAATTTTMMDAPLSTKSVTPRNVPKLKIELNSLKTRLSISKPKSAGVLQSAELTEKRERVKQRKRSLDEVPAPLTDHLDLETYAKNIGLLPIEVLTPPESADVGEKLKYSPNASPLSSASSTTSSSNNAFPLGATNELTTTTSFHKKRKKKHSKDSKDSKDSKRRRMHAEISSKPEEESLKMKVKLTTPHPHKSHRSDISGAKKSSEDGRKARVTEVKDLNAAAAKSTTLGQQSTAVLDNILALNKTLGEESRSINHLMKDSEKPPKEAVKVVKADETLLSLPQCNLLPKPVNNIKDTKLPASPPLPPSLFKTTPLNFNTLTVNSTSAGQTKHTPSGAKQPDLGKAKQILPTTTKTSSSIPQYGRQNSLNMAMTKSHPNFIVPSIPRRPSPGTNTSSYTPSSIASSSNKQMGLQLKRSASLDEHYALGQGRVKQPKLDAAQRKSLYSSYANKSFTAASATSGGGGKVTEITSGDGKDALTKAAHTPGAETTQTQSHWQLPPYTQLQLPFSSKQPAVEIVRINSNERVVDIPLHPAASSVPKDGGRMMGPPLSMVKGKKVGAQPTNAPSSVLSSTGSTTKSPPTTLNAAPLAVSSASSTTSAPLMQPKINNTYRLSPPALVNLSTTNLGASSASASKKANISAADIDAKKQKTNEKLTEKQLQQQRNSLRDFRPMREHILEIVDITGSSTGGDKDEVGAADTTISMPTARDSLEATVNKIKQNISSSSSTVKAQQSDDLQNLHLLSESATAREKIAIRGASQTTYEKPKMQQSTLVRQQNASVRNIPNPSALAFRNMATLPAAVVSSTPLTAANSNTTSSSLSTKITQSPASSMPTQIKLPLPLTTTAAAAAAPLSPGNILHSTSTIANSSSSSIPSTTAATRSVKKPTTIDQVAANLNMRASAAAAEAYAAAKLNATEDAAQISSSTNISAAATQGNNKKELTKAAVVTAKATTTTTISTSPNMAASSATSTNVPSVAAKTTATSASAIEIVEVVDFVKSVKDGTKKVASKAGDESGVKAKVLPKSIADSSAVTTTIDVADIAVEVASMKNSTNNNNNNSKNNNNNNNSNSKNNNTSGSTNNSNNSSSSNGKLGVTTASGVASD